MSTVSRRLSTFFLRRIVAITLVSMMIGLMVPPPTSAAVLYSTNQTMRAVGNQALTWLILALAALGVGGDKEDKRERKGVRPSPLASKAEREGQVASIDSNVTGDITLRSREPLQLIAVPLDQEGRTIQGLKVKWDSSNKRVVFVRKNGEVLAGMPGEATLTARVGGKQKTIRVTVVEGTREPYGGKKRVDSTRRPQQQALHQRMKTASELFPSEKKSRWQQRSHAVSKLLGPRVMPFIRDPLVDPLPDNETSSLYSPNNLIGTPPGKKKPGAMTAASSLPLTESGNRNFSFELPIVNLRGRGVDVALSLVYNSLVWHKSVDPSDSSTWMTYDVDSGYPAQGFRLGFGQIEDQGSAGFTLTEADGTRRALTYSSPYNYDTTDGSFIHFTGGSGWGTLFYPDGTQVTYGAAGGGYRSYPGTITDRNGNYITISYVNNVGPRISTILDTAGRYVRFYYDSNNDLVTVTMPGLTGQSDLQVMRFYYDNLTLPSGLYQSGINVEKPSTARVIKYIYLPTTGEGSSSSSGDVGYRFDYSAYGMIYQVLRVQGMTVSTTSTSSTGSVTSSESASNTAATTNYDYDTSASSRSDVPIFSKRTDEWAGRTGGGSAPEYEFSVTEATNETISTVTAPDDSVMVTTSIKNTGYWDDGLVKEIRVQNQDTTPVVFSKTQITWEQNSSNGTPRIANIKSTNEVNKTTAQVFTYDSNTPYNNVSVVSERDFTSNGSLGSELRRTETTYITSSGYLSRRLLRLPSMVKIFPGGSSTAAARIDYGYDNYSTSHADLTSRDDIIMHDPAFDPFQQTQETWDWVCTEWGYDEGFPICLNWEWQVVGSYNPYDSNTDYRGNVTSVTTYPDATSTSNAITHTTKYDIAGNVMSAQIDCCQSQSFTYSSANDDYAYPVSVTLGDPNGLHLTSSTSYDMNTGLMATSTDANSRITYFAYNADTLRTDTIDFPDGGQVSYDYANALAADSASRYHSSLVTTTKLDSSRYVDSKSYFDGRGAVTQTFNSYTSGDGWSIVDTEYDSMGRAYHLSNPYFCTSSYGSCSINPSGIWTTRTFDLLGRTTQVSLPRGDDANPSEIRTVSTTYAGDVTTVTDQAGKLRRQLTDALGRLIRLDEPTSSGLGAVSSANQSTSYMYDVLNNLVKITQDAQTRYFKYDSLSRLVREKVAEQDANSSYDLSDPLTGNSSWSRKLEYNSHGLVTNTYDARGISATLSYDNLNRLTGIDYSDSTPDRHYYYDSQTLPSGAPSYDHGYVSGRLIGMTYGTGANGTYFGYDSMGRVKEQRQVTDGNTYSLSYTYNLAGLLATETYPTSRVLTHSYDNAGRLSQIGDGTTTFVSSPTYAASGGLLSETWGNGAVRSIGYNNASQVSQIKLKQSSSGSELQRYDYLYGEVSQSSGSVDKSKNNGQIGRIDGVINGSSTKEWEQRFSYDELGRLSTAAEYQQGTVSTPSWKEEFTYDRYGNRFQSSGGNTSGYTTVVSSDITASTNRFITSGSTPVTYDAAGNVTQDAKFRYMNYTYDAEGRQVSASAMGSDLSQTSVYDCAGQRVQTTSFNSTRTMVYDIFGQLVADYNGTSMEKENIYRGGMILAVYEASSTCYMTISDFVTAFYQGALHRDPTSSELSQWTSDLSKAKAQGHGKLIEMAQALGNEVFGPSVYSTTNHNAYVTDLYTAYLQRSPDSGGLQNWLNALSGVATFSQVRAGFAYSMEFQGNVVRLCSGTSSSTSTSANLKYVLTDLQGSGRVLMDNSGSGSSTIVARHDYLPFGEEIWAGVGLRTTSQKYSTTDKVRQRFALTERDEVTGLDHTAFRKYDSFAGRWTTPDPLRGGLTDPQSFNRYSYTKNDPVNSVDPNGLCTFNIQLVGVQDFALADLKDEITRIFESGGHKVVFGNAAADGGSFTVNYVFQFPGDAVAQWQKLTNQQLGPDSLALTIPSDMTGYVSTQRVNTNAPATGRAGQVSQGTELGRLGAHEAITHGFLQRFRDTERGDITQAGSGRELLAKGITRWDIDGQTKAELDKLCDKSKNPVLPPPRPGPIVGGLPEPPISHFPGGDFPQLYPPGGPSELDWLIWLTDRMRPPVKKKEDEPV